MSELQTNPNCVPGNRCHQTCERHGRCMYAQMNPTPPAAALAEAARQFEYAVTQLLDAYYAYCEGDTVEFVPACGLTTNVVLSRTTLKAALAAYDRKRE